jgi:ATP-dependent DNA ligase
MPVILKPYAWPVWLGEEPADAPYAPGDRGLWLRVECLIREKFVVIGWTDPEGSRPFLGALLLGYYDPDGRLTYTGGRVGTDSCGGGCNL